MYGAITQNFIVRNLQSFFHNPLDTLVPHCLTTAMNYLLIITCLL